MIDHRDAHRILETIASTRQGLLEELARRHMLSPMLDTTLRQMFETLVNKIFDNKPEFSPGDEVVVQDTSHDLYGQCLIVTNVGMKTLHVAVQGAVVPSPTSDVCLRFDQVMVSPWSEMNSALGK